MNKLDKYGFNWYNPPENIEIVSTMNLLNEAVFYRFILEDPTQYMSTTLSVYRSFNLFITRVENLMNAHIYLHPDYIDSTLNLSDRVARAKELFAPFNELGGNAWYSLTIMEWADLEDITGEDLTVFKDRTLRVNEVFGVGLLTKMYKVVDAFRYRRQQNSAEAHLAGDFIAQDTYVDFDTQNTEYTGTGISTVDFLDSYEFPNVISYSADNAYDEFVANLGIRDNNVVTLTTQLNTGDPNAEPLAPNFFPTDKYWDYHRTRTFISGSSDSNHRYMINEDLTGRRGCPVSPVFSRGNTTNVYQSPTQVFNYNQSQDITDIDFYEAYCFWQISNPSINFGTGLIENDGGVIPYTKNQDNTMQTGVFANFSYASSNYPKDTRMERANDNNNPRYDAADIMRLGSRTFFNLNDAEFNEYKTASPTN